MCCAGYAATPLSTHSRKGPAKHSRIPASDTRNITTYAATAAMLAASTPPAEATMKYTHVTGKAMAACAKNAGRGLTGRGPGRILWAWQRRRGVFSPAFSFAFGCASRTTRKGASPVLQAGPAPFLLPCRPRKPPQGQRPRFFGAVPPFAVKGSGHSPTDPKSNTVQLVGGIAVKDAGYSPATPHPFRCPTLCG